MKCLSTSGKTSLFMHPDEQLNPKLPVGAPFNMCALKCTRGNTKASGKAFPVAFTQAHMVTFSPRSPEVILPTCFVPA